MLRHLLILLIGFVLCMMPIDLIFAAPVIQVTSASQDTNVRDTSKVTVDSKSVPAELSTFVGWGWGYSVVNFFYSLSDSWDQTVPNVFIWIAWAIKNFFIAVAALFLIIGILKLLFSGGDEEAQKKWKNNIIWVTVGIFVMQIGYSLWTTLYLRDTNSFISGQLGWRFWTGIFEPIVNIMLLLASFAFMAMAVYSFYTIIIGGWDEEKLKKWKNIFIYALIGFLLIRIPKFLVIAIYGEPTAACRDTTWLAIWACQIGNKNLSEGVNIVGKILTYINGFLALFAVVMILYAGWLVFLSGGDEEKLKKAKKIILYVALGIILLVASQAIFRFFFLRG